MHGLRTWLRSITDRRSTDAISTEATRWLDNTEPGDRAKEELADWLRASPRNVRAFLKESERRGWYDSGLTYSRAPAQRPRARWPLFATLSGVAAVLVSVQYFLEAPTSPDVALPREHSAMSGSAPGLMQLADGSTIDLSARTTASAQLDASTRLIALEQGAGLFSVVADAARLFEVQAPCGLVRTHGARFVLSLRATGICDVAVLEGEVSLTGANRPTRSVVDTQRAVLLHPGQIAAFSRVMLTVKASDHEAARRRESWIHGLLVLQGDPLEEVVEVYNRYNRQQLVITDPEVGRLTLGGRIRADDSATFALALERIGVQIVHREDGAEISLSPSQRRRTI